jgi:hypothetical protein
MAIEINKSGNGGNSGSARPNYSDPNSSDEVREIYRFTYDCKQKNMPDYQIEQSLMNRGLDASEVATVMRTVNQAFANRQQAQSQPDDSGGGGGFPRILIYIGILILVNVLSAAFGWGFWLY